MNKLIFAAFMSCSVSSFAQSSIAVGNNNALANGYVTVDPFGHNSSQVTGSYGTATTFTIQLWSLPNNAQSFAGADAYGYANIISVAGLTSAGFQQVVNIGNLAGANGVFDGPIEGIVPNNTGAFPFNATIGGTILALVGWTGNEASLDDAVAAGEGVGVLTMLSPLGPGGADPRIPWLFYAWNGLANSPASAANGGSQDFVLAPVPEPGTLALAGLGGFGMLMAFRRKKA
jgi:hypothetical protein